MRRFAACGGFGPARCGQAPTQLFSGPMGVEFGSRVAANSLLRRPLARSADIPFKFSSSVPRRQAIGGQFVFWVLGCLAGSLMLVPGFFLQKEAIRVDARNPRGVD